MWDWEWIDYDLEQSDDAESESVAEEQTPADNFSDKEDFSSTLITHSVVFKCIGATKELH